MKYSCQNISWIRRDNMNSESAESLIEETFSNEFKIENFIEFITELFNGYDRDYIADTNIPAQYDDYVKTVYYLGNYTDNYGDNITFLAVELKKSSSIRRARTLQRNFVAHYLKRKNRKIALVAFFDSSSDDWRFSFIKRSMDFGSEGLNVKLSHPKRHSFLVGPNEPNHTCKSQFKELLQNEEETVISDIENAFQIENVTEEFYKQYKKLFSEFKKSLEEIIDNDNVIKEEFVNKDIKSDDFAKKLMGQLVFVYFLQKKGFLGVEKDHNWGTGPKNFLKKLYDGEYGEYENFFDEKIEPLFYEGLSVDTNDYHYGTFGYKIPFLNSGLFEPINDYDWKHTNIKLDNSIFEKIIKTFDRFNFTVKEDESLEKDVAIDPEMLGKVYENLLEIEEKSKDGTYYTPRFVVHYMCQEVLINYLSNNSQVTKEDLRKFITSSENLIESLIGGNEEISEDETEIFHDDPFIDSIKNNSNELYSLLCEVKIIDPAVGSGAFLVSMMNEIVKAKHVLLQLNGNDDIDFYELKKETIENSLYGVDIKQSAIEITKLRFCLSLIVDEENHDFIRPLPNLDNKIMCGNSLVDSFKGIKLFDYNLINETSGTIDQISKYSRLINKLESKKCEYFKTSSFTGKNILKNDINKLKLELVESYLRRIEKQDLASIIKNGEFNEDKTPFFIWELEFSEVFKAEDPGFDVVISHPPFGKKHAFGYNLTRAQDRYLKDKYSHCKNEKAMYFTQLSYDRLLKSSGELGFIIPKTFAYVYNYSSIRSYILKDIETIIDCGSLGKSRGEQIILILNKKKNDDFYNNWVMIDEQPANLKKILKEDAQKFGIILNNVNDKEISLAKKIKKSDCLLKSVIKSQMGDSLQSNEWPNEKFEFLGGNEIQREGIVAIKGKIGEEYIQNDKSHIKENSVLVQEILSIGHGVLKITACIPNRLDLYICNTILQIEIENLTNLFNNYFIWALFNSRLINWYSHKFIFANAIRTMHFNHSVEEIPLPSLDNRELINNITDKSIELNEKYEKLLSYREPIFNSIRDNIQFDDKLINFESLSIDEFVDILKSKQNLTIGNTNENKFKNFKKFFNDTKDSYMEINEKISSLSDDSIESKYGLSQELQLLKENMFDYLRERIINNIKTSTNGKIRTFEVLNYDEFINKLTELNVDVESIENLEELFKDKKKLCLEINKEIKCLENDLETLIYQLYDLTDEDIEIVDKYFGELVSEVE